MQRTASVFKNTHRNLHNTFFARNTFILVYSILSEKLPNILELSNQLTFGKRNFGLLPANLCKLFCFCNFFWPEHSEIFDDVSLRIKISFNPITFRVNKMAKHILKILQQICCNIFNVCSNILWTLDVIKSHLFQDSRKTFTENVWSVAWFGTICTI